MLEQQTKQSETLNTKQSETLNTKQSDSHNKYYSLVLQESEIKALLKQARKQDSIIVIHLTKLKQHKDRLQLNLTYEEIQRQAQISKDERQYKQQKAKGKSPFIV